MEERAENLFWTFWSQQEQDGNTKKWQHKVIKSIATFLSDLCSPLCMVFSALQKVLEQYRLHTNSSLLKRKKTLSIKTQAKTVKCFCTDHNQQEVTAYAEKVPYNSSMSYNLSCAVFVQFSWKTRVLSNAFQHEQHLDPSWRSQGHT